MGGDRDGLRFSQNAQGTLKVSFNLNPRYAPSLKILDTSGAPEGLPCDRAAPSQGHHARQMSATTASTQLRRCSTGTSS